MPKAERDMGNTEWQRRFVERRKAQGLVLKRVWVPPAAWPAIKDLATQEAEEFAFADRYSTATASEHETAYVYELARGLWAEIQLQATANQASDPHSFCLRVLRAMIKTAPAPFTVTPEQAAKARRIINEEDDEDGNV